MTVKALSALFPVYRLRELRLLQVGDVSEVAAGHGSLKMANVQAPCRMLASVLRLYEAAYTGVRWGRTSKSVSMWLYVASSWCNVQMDVMIRVRAPTIRRMVVEWGREASRARSP